MLAAFKGFGDDESKVLRQRWENKHVAPLICRLFLGFTDNAFEFYVKTTAYSNLLELLPFALVFTDDDKFAISRHRLKQILNTLERMQPSDVKQLELVYLGNRTVNTRRMRRRSIYRPRRQRDNLDLLDPGLKRLDPIDLILTCGNDPVGMAEDPTLNRRNPPLLVPVIAQLFPDRYIRVAS